MGDSGSMSCCGGLDVVFGGDLGGALLRGLVMGSFWFHFPSSSSSSAFFFFISLFISFFPFSSCLLISSERASERMHALKEFGHGIA